MPSHPVSARPHRIATFLIFLTPGVANGLMWILITRVWNSENWSGLFIFPPLFVAMTTAGYLAAARMLRWHARQVVPRTILATVAWIVLWGVVGGLDPEASPAGHSLAMLLFLAPATVLNLWKSSSSRP